MDLWTLSILLVCFVQSSLSSWSSGNQFHIQTDEGPERYFKYQTQSGQYRKEKRLQDGTVVGSYGWIDADGYLRLRDYIADDQGYRILKSKTIYVGQDRPIDEAIKSSKGVPPQSGILVKPGHEKILPSKPVSTPAPNFNTYLVPSSTPQIFISHNSIETSTPRPNIDLRPTIAPLAITTAYTQRPLTSSTQLSDYLPPISSTTYAPPVSSTTYASPISSTTYAPPISSSTYASPISSSSFAPSPPSKIFLPPYEGSSIPPPIVAITSNSLDSYRKKFKPSVTIISSDNEDYVPSSNFESLRNTFSTNSLNLDPYSVENTPVDRTDDRVFRKRYNSRYQSNNNLGNGYDPQFAEYDGVSVTKNGFRYFLPRQYHEEENSGGDTRTGSFGYIDPFGIRRVIYYNTSPGQGFVHRKNNRYVGFRATPYDPRP